MESIVVSNWKMHFSFSEACNYLNLITSLHGNLNIAKVIFAVPNLYLSGLKLKFNDTYHFSAQDVSMITESSGPYTGEISASMLKNLNVNYAIVGHSERRLLFYEDANTIASKVRNCINNAIVPIVCIGEPIEARKNKTYLQYIAQQLSSISFSFTKNIIIAYEPVWSIGSCMVPTIDDIYEVVTMIREIQNRYIPHNIENSVKIVYGGSVSANNINQILTAGIDGVLIGKASLKLESLTTIIKTVQGLD
ncbi:triose-phosphate isomerase [Orientia tsutsugamushi]|uniref:Triosephosphate isomerase n=1 Tax=Orientia tsutsugamushi (strain Boryong) TaxID=357244 RepID=TPIS_ORITB|nr:triose-phosphate isomerase [Orientia tsutsugamushi]A5CC41.1 RecName: Full=Triosephosphate isomerase; Short=TIM; Short=TPI; AltName: Full=Triose-phosphate isomerase [Orientia tsutsugamushi str. Boryong]CAM79206.1 triosephosphate isomerase [Orientia tsutsugamushi str. Boryong]